MDALDDPKGVRRLLPLTQSRIPCVFSSASELATAGPLAATPVMVFQDQRVLATFRRKRSWHLPCTTNDRRARPGRTSCEPTGGNVMTTIVTNAAKKLIHDKIESQIKIATAKLETLKAKAQAAKATIELGLITDLLTKKHAIDRKVDDLKKSTDTTYQETKLDVESRLAELEKAVQAVEAKFKTATNA
jgi:hypothetical protein